MPPLEGGTAERRLRSARDLEAALTAVAAAADDWGGEWRREGTGGRLDLPAQAGLRHGLLQLAVRGRDEGARGSELAFALTEERWLLHRPAVALLLAAALGGVAILLWPFVPGLGGLVPLALVLGVGAWLVVVSRLRHHGLTEFLADLDDRLAPHEQGSAPDAR